MKRILLVDDDKSYAKEFEDFFSLSYDIKLLHTEAEFYQKFNPYSTDLVILDIRLSDQDEGLGILKHIKAENPFLPVVMITGYDSTDYYTEAISLGAEAYLNKKKFNYSAIKKVLDTILEKSSLQKQVSSLEKRIENLEPNDIIGTSPQTNELKDKIKMAAEDGNITVQVNGETGVGKELVARNIHKIGARKKGPFFTCMVAGIPGDVIYSELFGHEKGAFTSAHSKRRGIIEESHKGVLFLDEIGELDLEAQIKLLRVIEYQTFSRLGSNKEIEVDVQFIVATNKDLHKLVEEKKFREDLYFRLKTFEINVTPLRSRMEDITVLAEFFLQGMLKAGRTTATKFSKEILELFQAYNWPGNVRELKNIVESLCTYARFKNKEIIDSEFIRYLDGIVTKTSHMTANSHLREFNFEKNLAIAESQLIEEAISLFGRKKTKLAHNLQYNDRFVLLRRTKRCFEKFPELKDRFLKTYELFH